MLRTLQLDTSWGRLSVAGGSRAGEGTLVLLPQLRLVLDPGRAHRSLPRMSTVVLSHGHADHLGGLGYWASQRYLHSMGPATLLVPQAIAADVRRLLELLARLEGGRPYEVTIEEVTEGSHHDLRRDIRIGFFTTDHWVPTLGAELQWRRQRLRDELAGLPPEEIATRRAAGEQVTVEQRCSLLSYCADTGPRLLARCPGLLATEVLLLECSFFRPEDRSRAEQYGHLHIEDLLDLRRRLTCRHLVLLHPSRRHRLREVEQIIDQRLRPELGCQLDHLMVDWD
jgi:ribonuclease Z